MQTSLDFPREVRRMPNQPKLRRRAERAIQSLKDALEAAAIQFPVGPCAQCQHQAALNAEGTCLHCEFGYKRVES